MTRSRMFFGVKTFAASLALGALGCGGSSPSAPSSTATNTPAATVAATLNLNGTWLAGNEPAFTITQNGTTITGTQIYSPVPGVGVVITETGTVSGTLTGTTAGSTLTLSLVTTTKSVGSGALADFSITCISEGKWVGQVTNTTMAGTYSSGQFSCDGLGAIVVPKVSGPVNYTKQ